MKYYLELTLLPDAEANLGFLWQKVYQQIHLALVENKVGENSSAIGLSIPEYRTTECKAKAFPLGTKIRLFANEQSTLEKVNIEHWLKRLQDYVHIKSIQLVPNGVAQFACFTRKPIKGEARIAKDILKKAKHQSLKFNVPYDECVKKLTETAPNNINNAKTPPFISVQSLSSDKEQGNKLFPLFIEMILKNNAKENNFNCYGLSSKSEGETATVPWF